MSEYRLDVKGDLNLSDFSSIYDYIGIVDYNDNFTITLNHVKEENINIIYEMLERQNLKVINLEKNSDDIYYIKASKI